MNMRGQKTVHCIPSCMQDICSAIKPKLHYTQHDANRTCGVPHTLCCTFQTGTWYTILRWSSHWQQTRHTTCTQPVSSWVKDPLILNPKIKPSSHDELMQFSMMSVRNCCGLLAAPASPQPPVDSCTRRMRNKAHTRNLLPPNRQFRLAKYTHKQDK